jgi:hypothetical protein
MKPIYEEIKVTTAGNDSKILKRIDEDGSIWWIPMDEANSDYQAYLNKDKAEQLNQPIGGNK